MSQWLIEVFILLRAREMKVKVIVQSEQLSKDDLRCLLQAIRDCEQSFFREKEIWIVLGQ